MISDFDKAAADVALENGADTWLAKPFTKGQLFEAVRNWLADHIPLCPSVCSAEPC